MQRRMRERGMKREKGGGGGGRRYTASYMWIVLQKPMWIVYSSNRIMNFHFWLNVIWAWTGNCTWIFICPFSYCQPRTYYFFFLSLAWLGWSPARYLNGYLSVLFFFVFGYNIYPHADYSTRHEWLHLRTDLG